MGSGQRLLLSNQSDTEILPRVKTNFHMAYRPSAPEGSSALHSASSRGHKDIVQDLLHPKADLEATDVHGASALYEAFYSAKASGTELIPKPRTQCIHVLCVVAVNHVVHAAVCFLLEEGSNMNYIRRGQRTLLHGAARGNKYQGRQVSIPCFSRLVPNGTPVTMVKS